VDEGAFLAEFNKEFRGMYEAYNKAVSEHKYDEAIKVGEEMLRKLLEVVKSKLLPKLSNPITREVARSIVEYHEKSLAYIEGIKEATSDVPTLYSFEAKERALEAISRNVQELFSFTLGALLVLTEVAIGSKPKGHEII